MRNDNKKYVTVTGASSGIGYETAKAFAKRRKNLIIVARRKNSLEKLLIMLASMIMIKLLALIILVSKWQTF